MPCATFMHRGGAATAQRGQGAHSTDGAQSDNAERTAVKPYERHGAGQYGICVAGNV